MYVFIKNYIEFSAFYKEIDYVFVSYKQNRSCINVYLEIGFEMNDEISSLSMTPHWG